MAFAVVWTIRYCNGRREFMAACVRNESLAILDTVLREGDLVFRRGNGITSRAVLAADRGGVYSHVGIAVRVAGQGGGEQATGSGADCGVDGESSREGAAGMDGGGCADCGDGGWSVVHVVPGEPGPDGTVDRIKAEPLAEFFSLDRARRGAVARVNVPFAAALLEAPGAMYADAVYTEVAVEARRLAACEIFFDHDYDLTDTTRMYCTELVYRVFMRAAGVDPTAGRRSRIGLPGFDGEYILPSDILQSETVTIKYQF